MLIFIASPSIAKLNNEQLFTLGNAERSYQNGDITCYLGTLFPGHPIYWCGFMQNEQFVMIKSYFVYQTPQMNIEMSGASTSTYTVQPKR